MEDFEKLINTIFEDDDHILTGIEDFDWEEKYLFGHGEEGEYEKMKKTHPSYTDILPIDENEPVEIRLKSNKSVKCKTVDFRFRDNTNPGKVIIVFEII